MTDGLSASAARVQAALEASGVAFEVKELDASTRTAKEAAAAIGCTVAQIAKSIIFRTQGSGRPVLVVASGVNRIDEAKVATALGEGLGKADADFVRDRTGYVIGGVPPLGHAEAVETFIDSDLLVPGRHLGRRRDAARRLPPDGGPAPRDHRWPGDRSCLGRVRGRARGTAPSKHTVVRRGPSPAPSPRSRRATG